MSLVSQRRVREGAAETAQGELTIDLIKGATRKFDLETVYNLQLSSRGIQVRHGADGTCEFRTDPPRPDFCRASLG